MKKGLLLVDIQKDYFPGGKHELLNPIQAAERAREILEFFRRNGLPVYHIRHISERPNASFFLEGTTGSEIHPICAPIEGETVLIKHRPNSFLGTRLKEELDSNRIEALVICGMMTHMCIDTTVRAANTLGYPVELIEDACTTRDLEWNGTTIPADLVEKAFMSAIDGSFGEVVRAKNWLEAQNSK